MNAVQVESLDHVNLRAPRPTFERLLAFYRDVLGLRHGPRPAFGSEGAWLYAGGRPVVHLSLPRGDDAAAGAPEAAAAGVIDHVAFGATDPAGALHALRALGIDVHETKSAATRQHQLFLRDPAGNGVELNFPYAD